MGTWWWWAFAPIVLGAPDAPHEPGVETLAPVVSGPSLRPGPARPADVVVVCPAGFRPALQPWIERRQFQGHHIQVLDCLSSARTIRDKIRSIAAGGQLRYIVLVGDADPEMVGDPFVRQRCVPTFYAQASVNTKWGSEPYIPTDNPYADLNGDTTPDVAIGRISVDSIADLTTQIQKILRYESLPPTGLWRRRVEIVAGVGGFGPLADAAVETAAKKFITSGLPAAYNAAMTYASFRSPYCPDPNELRQIILNRFQHGSAFWVYMGHGRPYRLDRLKFGDETYRLLESADVRRVNCDRGLPIAVMLACYTGAFDQPLECISENLLRQPKGPIAVISGSRVTMPYAMSVLGTALMDGYFVHRLGTLGDVYLYGKRSLGGKTPSQGPNRKLLDSIAKTLAPVGADLEAERNEHQQLFNLLGDPTLRLFQPKRAKLACRSHIDSGKLLKFDVTSPIGGVCLVELVCRRDRLTFDPPRRRGFDEGEAATELMTRTYLKANDRRWATIRVQLQPGRSTLEIPVPKHADGESIVRVFIDGGTDCAVGDSPVFIQNSSHSGELRTSNAQRS